MAHTHCKIRKNGGFSLLELLTVVAIICILVALLVPSVAAFTSTGGRKGAVTLVMTTLEQARVSAIETGREVIVVFWKKNGAPGFAPDEQDAMLVLRRNDSDTDWEPITRWLTLPRGILFHGEDPASQILKDHSGLQAVTDQTISSLPGKPAKDDLGAVHFSSTGAIQLPSTSDGLRIALTEGQRGPDGTLVVNKQKDGGHEVISLARYTGRVTLDINML